MAALRFGDELEIVASPTDRSAIRIRPRQSRFSALIVVRLNELDEDSRRIALARLLRRPVEQALPQAKVNTLPKAKLVWAPK